MRKLYYIASVKYGMAKATKKSAKKSSDIFHNIMAASVKGNPKPKKKATKKK